MFGLINTKDLYLVKLDIISHSDIIYENGRYFEKFYLASNSRYALAKKNMNEYIDIFTGTKYSTLHIVGSEVIVKASPIITNKSYITNEEAFYILQELNLTYLDRKTLKLNRR